MQDATLTVTDRGIAALAGNSNNLENLDVHVIITCLGTEHRMLEIVESIQKVSTQRKFLDPKYVADAVHKLLKGGYLRLIEPPVQPVTRNKRGKKYAR